MQTYGLLPTESTVRFEQQLKRAGMKLWGSENRFVWVAPPATGTLEETIRGLMMFAVAGLKTKTTPCFTGEAGASTRCDLCVPL